MPPWLPNTLLLVAGLAVLGVGGECLVRGAARLAQNLGVSALVVGLTIVAFGTSAPEAAVTIFAAVQNSADLAIGNVVGSNIANILLILGLAAAVSPLRVPRSLVRVDGPVMVVTAAAFMAAAWWHHEISRAIGCAFVVGLIVYTTLTVRLARRTGPPREELTKPPEGLGRYRSFNLLLVIVGIVGLVGGARLIVVGATELARLVQISEQIIGLTIVAIGTSLPELATTVVAARHKQSDIAIGNVIGSNIFNVLFVTGMASSLQPLTVPADIRAFDGPLMLAISVGAFVLLWGRRTLGRVEGTILLASYVAYLLWTGQAMLART